MFVTYVSCHQNEWGKIIILFSVVKKYIWMVIQAKASLIAPDPDAYVRTALRSVGLIRETTGHPGHQFQVALKEMLIVLYH